MASSLFEELRGYVGFDASDEENLRQLSGPLDPRLDSITEALHAKLNEHPVARSAIRESGSSALRVRSVVTDWLKGMLHGPYDEQYLARRSRIGHVHVRMRIPQYYMVAAANLVRLALVREVQNLTLKDKREKIRSLHKIIDIEIAIIMEVFRDAYAERVRQSERQTLMERIRESEHLANIGELAAALAHEIKNPLAGISGAIQVIASALAPDDPHREIVDEILSLIDRMDATVRDLLVYARPKPPDRSLQRVGVAVRRALMLLREEPAMQGIDVRCEGLDCDAEALIDEAQFQQVITNLLLNAADACEKDGQVSIGVIGGNGFVRVEVADTGKGMGRAEAERALEPFFTTKAKGTGLGLPICKRIIDAHDGRMEIQSQQGTGTKITIELPSDV